MVDQRKKSGRKEETLVIWMSSEQEDAGGGELGGERRVKDGKDGNSEKEDRDEHAQVTGKSGGERSVKRRRRRESGAR